MMPIRQAGGPHLSRANDQRSVAMRLPDPGTAPDDWGEEGGAEGQNRTADTTIFSRMLYQLSYLGTG